MEIGLFQLENLILSRVKFCFFDLREENCAPALPDPLRKIMAEAVALKAEHVEKYLLDNGLEKEAPIVLVCQTGKLSIQVAVRLEQLGFRQVYVVEGGVDGMLLEL